MNSLARYLQKHIISSRASGRIDVILSSLGFFQDSGANKTVWFKDGCEFVIKRMPQRLLRIEEESDKDWVARETVGAPGFDYCRPALYWTHDGPDYFWIIQQKAAIYPWKQPKRRTIAKTIKKVKKQARAEGVWIDLHEGNIGMLPCGRVVFFDGI